MEYATRIAEEVPHENTLKFEYLTKEIEESIHPNRNESLSLATISFDSQLNNWKAFSADEAFQNIDAEYLVNTTYSLECLGEFRQKLVNFFHADLTENFESSTHF